MKIAINFVRLALIGILSMLFVSSAAIGQDQKEKPKYRDPERPDRTTGERSSLPDDG